MKKKLKKVVIPCLLSIICGTICGKLVFGIYNKELKKDTYGEKIYLIQSGAYKDYDNMVKNTSLNNYVYYKDEDGLFKSIIGLTEEQENIEKIKSTYDKETIISEYYSNNKELNKQIKNYDNQIKKLDNTEEIKKITLEMLELYKDKNTTLTQIIS